MVDVVYTAEQEIRTTELITSSWKAEVYYLDLQYQNLLIESN
jgi:hypothetical protein